MNAYSKDLRLKVLDAVERGVPRKEVSWSRLPLLGGYLRRRYLAVGDTVRPPGPRASSGSTKRCRRYGSVEGWGTVQEDGLRSGYPPTLALAAGAK